MKVARATPVFMSVMLFLTTLFPCAGCVSGRFSTYAIPMRVSGTVEDAGNGKPLDDVELTFTSATILHPTVSTVGTAVNGKFDLSYILGFCRKERMRRGKYESPNDKFKIVVTREGYVPAVFDFALNEIGEGPPYPLELGIVALTPN